MILPGDCRKVLRALPDASVDAVVCDPPYELGFLGRAWDSTGIAFDPALWAEVARVLKPGGHLIAFGGQRTIHRIACAIEDGGFEIRDLLGWMFFSGFPKSLDISKEMDRLAGAEREVVGASPWNARKPNGSAGVSSVGLSRSSGAPDITAPASPAAVQWSGWGTALKPAIEPAILARKPLAESSIARQVLATGTGALNIDGCRHAPGDPAWVGPGDDNAGTHCTNRDAAGKCLGHSNAGQSTSGETFHGPDSSPAGRWPANLIYCPKASRAEREAGCEALPAMSGAAAVGRAEGSAGAKHARAGAGGGSSAPIHNDHPTVKPIALMRRLVRLVTPPGGVVLDPFTGSGTTGIAVVSQPELAARFVGVELDAHHVAIAEARIAHARRMVEDGHTFDEWTRKWVRRTE